MLLLEHDAKALLAARGIAVPAGVLAERDGPSPVPPGAPPWMVKAQVPVGGRGKAGAIIKVTATEALPAALADIFGMNVRGYEVGECLIEQAIDGAAEHYISLSIDPVRAGVAIVLSPNGGVDIEDQPPDALAIGFAALDEDSVLAEIERLATGMPTQIRAAGERLARIFLSGDLVLLEINPLLSLADGSWVAADAKIIFDETALARQPFMEERLKSRAAAYPSDSFKREQGFDFVLLDPDGQVGLVTTGAGLTMQVVDELAAENVRAFNFCDIRSGMMRGDPARLIRVLSHIADGPAVQAVLVNIFAGITNLGEFARLLVTAVGKVDMPGVTFVVRLVGNAAEEGGAVLRESGLAFVIEPDLDAAVAIVAGLARRGRGGDA